MKKHLFLFSLTAALALSFSLPGLAKPSDAAAAKNPAPLYESASKDSYYGLGSQFIDQAGTTVPFSVYRGQPVIISMFYASCNYTCPILIDTIKQIEKKLKPEVLAKTRVLLVSFDPENDTSKVLADLFKRHNLDAKRWKLVSGADADIRDVAALLDFRYRKLAQGGFNHTTVISILDEEGTLLQREEGFQGVAESLSAKLNALYAKD